MWLSEPIPNRPPAARKCRRVEDAVAEIGLGFRAEPGDRARRGPALRFPPSVMCVAWMSAPALVDRQRVQQIFDRRAAAPGEAVLDFAGLLGDVDVDRAAACERQDLVDLFRRRGAERMGGNADPGAWLVRRHAGRRFHQAGEAVDVVDEPPLARGGRTPPKPPWA